MHEGDVITSDQTIYVYASNGTCISEESFTVTFGSIVADVLNDVTVCDGYVLPSLSSNNAYHTQANGGGDVLAAGSTVTGTQTIYIWASAGTCTDQSTFIVTVNATPVLPPRANVVACDSYALPAPSAGAHFYDQPGGSGTQLDGQAISASGTTTVYEYAQTGTAPNCTAEISFTVTVNQSPVADTPANVSQCEPYALPALTSGGYYSQSGGQGPIAAGTVIAATQTIWVWASNGDCTDESSFTVSIGTTPSFTFDSGCQGSQYVLGVLASNGFTSDEVSYQWTTSGGQIIGPDTAPTVVVEGAADYTVTVTWNGCSRSQTLTVDSTGCTIQKGISPNGDGYNDYFDLEGQNVTKLQIFNRYGTVVYSKGGYTNQWYGQSDGGEELPDGTYYYVIDRAGGESRTGWIYISRERN